MDLYQELIKEHAKHPKGHGLREPFAAEVHHVNPTCGDEVTLRVAMDGDRVVDVSYDGQGCSISRASVSVLHELLVGARVDEAMATYDAFHELVTGRGQVEPDEEILGDGVAFAGVARYPMRVKCALLGWMAFRDAVVRATDESMVGGPA